MGAKSQHCAVSRTATLSGARNHFAGSGYVFVIDALCKSHLRRQALKGVIILREGVPCQDEARPLLLLRFLLFIYLWHV